MRSADGRYLAGFQIQDQCLRVLFRVCKDDACSHDQVSPPPRSDSRLVRFHIAAPDKKKGEPEDEIDVLEKDITQGREEIVVIGEDMLPLEPDTP